MSTDRALNTESTLGTARTMGTDRGINFKYSFLQASYWLLLQATFPFLIMIYQSYGFSNMTIGMIATGIAAGCAIGQPLYGIVCDKFQSVKKVVIPMIILGCAVLMFLPFGEGKALLTGIIVVTVNICFSDLIPVFDGWGARLKADGHKLNYGFCRSFGSLFYAIGGLCGIVYDAAGLWLIYPVMIVLSLFMIVSVGTLPDPVTASEKKPKLLSMFKVLVKSRRYVSLLVVTFLCYIANNCFFVYYPLFLQEMGGGSGPYGVALFVMNVCEVPVMLLSKKYLKKIKAHHLLMISFAFQGIRYLLVSVAPNVGFGIGANVIHGLCFGLMYVAWVEYLPKFLDKEILISAQTIMTAVGIGGGTVGATVAGIMTSTIGIRNMYHIIGIFPAAALVIFVITYNAFKKDPILKMSSEEK